MRKFVKSMLSIILTMPLLMVQFANAQGQLNATFRPSFSDPVNDLGSTNLKKGGGFEATISYRFIPRFAAYGGWGMNTFNPEKSDNAVDHFAENGYRFGFQYFQPLSTDSKLNFIISAGGVFNHIETENDDGDVLDDTGHGLGCEASVGLSIPLNKRWQIIPDVRYHSLSRDITIETVKESVDLNYVSVGVGVSWTLVGY